MVAPASERLHTEVERDQTQEILGMALLVMLYDVASLSDEEILLLTVEETTQRAETGKFVEQRGVPQETARDGESYRHTLMGAMEELVPVGRERSLGSKYRRVVSRESNIMPIESLPGNNGAIEILVFSGGNVGRLNDEVRNPKWMRAHAIVDDATIRTASREAVSHAIDNRFLSEGMQQHRSGLTVPVFDSVRDYRSILTQRKQYTDKRPANI